MQAERVKLNYHPEIDGLRAIAVLLIIFFHYEFNTFTSGFLGVDIFFVISGYLITRLLVYQSENNIFQFKSFYIRRMRRLVPSLVCTCLLTLFAGTYLAEPSQIEELYKSTLFGILGVSNFYFVDQLSYFNIISSLKPLLHTWSLGVEEQYYLFWPALIIFSMKFKRKFILVFVLFIIFCGSLGLNVIYQSDPKLIFYMMPFRVFEFSIGAFIVFFERYRVRRIVSSYLGILIGSLTIFYSLYSYEENFLNNLYCQLSICFGTSLLIIYAKERIFLSKILNNKLLVSTGKISYSLYLIHWPVFVLFQLNFLREASIAEKLTMIGVTFLLAKIQYELVEQKFRINSESNIEKKKYFLAPYYFLVVIVLFLMSYYFLDKIESARSNGLIPLEKVQKIESQLNHEKDNACLFFESEAKESHLLNCNKNSKTQILTIGNSHEFDSYLTFKKLYRDKSSNIEIFWGNTDRLNGVSCLFQLRKNDVVAKSEVCKDRAYKLSNFVEVAKRFDLIILGAIFPMYYRTKFYLDYIQRLQKINPDLKVIIHGSLGSLKQYNCVGLINRFNDYKACNRDREKVYFNTNDERVIRQNYPNIKFYYLDRVPLFCRFRDLKSCDLVTNGIPLFFDGHHFNYAGILEQVKRIRENKKVYSEMKSIIDR